MVRGASVAILWAFTALLSGIALLPVYTNEGNALVPFIAGLLALALYVWFHPGVRSAREATGRTHHPTAVVGTPSTSGPVEVVDLEERRRRRA